MPLTIAADSNGTLQAIYGLVDVSMGDAVFLLSDPK
jgi:hypothetical protein